MFGKFTEEAQKILVVAKKEMMDLQHPYVGSEHLLLAILKEENIVSKKLKMFNISYQKFKDELVNIMGTGTNKSQWFLYTPLLKRVIENAILDSKESNDSEVTIEHLFSALLEEGEGVAIRTLLSMKVDMDKLSSLFSKQIVSRKTKKKNLLVEEMATNLTKKAADNELDPVIGREKEIRRVLEILCRRTKNNPLLIGEAGVGKTAIVEELSRMIVEGTVPDILKNKKILLLEMATMVAGTKYRGEFEERMKKILNELEENEDIIIFIDEIHTLVGAGGAEGAIDASNIFKPALARNKIRCIGATTTSEYKKYIENDSALDRRFQKVYIEAPDKNTVKQIMMTLKDIYESFHHVTLSENIINLIIDLSERYVYDRNQPDKAIDILDEVCAKVSLKETKDSKQLKDLYKQLEQIRKDKNSCIVKQDFNKAYKYRESEEEILNEINTIELNLMKTHNIREVLPKHVAEVINFKTKIPVYEILNDNVKIFNHLKKELSENIIGQDKAIDSLINVTKRIKLGYKDENKCYSYLFCGPTGVGKTELAKVYAKQLVDEKNVIKLDMSEYAEAHTISKIIGAPPGYVGYEDNKNILEEVRNKPHSVIILDEIERAHQSVLNLFFQILDEAKIKDSNGKVIRFDNVLIIMTTNIGFSKNTVGFNNLDDDKIMSKLKKHLTPEFVNRIYNFIIFNHLTKDDISKIIDRQLKKMKKRFNNINIVIDKNVIEEIIELSSYKDFGARKIEKIVQDKLESIIIDNIMKKNNKLNITTIKEYV